jgi:WD40 repeat protein
MTDDTRADIASVAERTRPVTAGGPVFAAHILGSTAVFTLGESEHLFVAPDGGERRIAVHDGGILSVASDGARIVTGGDDGKVVATDAAGGTVVVATDPKRRWIDHVALAPDGAVAWSAGKQVFVQPPKGEVRTIDVPSTAGGLAFAPKGFRIAIAHYGGATLWFPNVKAEPERFEWKGSHLGVRFSPDGRFLVTTMQESILHGWRIADHKDLRMQGYSARVRSLDWSMDGKWFATSGSDQLVLWPFQSKDGPMGKTPKLLAPTDQQLEVVACHPKQPVVAVGFADGLVLLVRIDDGAEILARKPAGAPVTALAWRGDGKMLAFGTDDGDAGLVDLS